MPYRKPVPHPTVGLTITHTLGLSKTGWLVLRHSSDHSLHVDLLTPSSQQTPASASHAPALPTCVAYLITVNPRELWTGARFLENRKPSLGPACFLTILRGQRLDFRGS